MRLLEREGLLIDLRAHAQAAGRGDGRLLFVNGEAGVGKSVLVEQFWRRHAGDAVVLCGACEAMSTPRPLAPVLDFAAELGDEFGALLAAGANPRTLFASMLAKFRSSKRPHLIIVEDLHWADDGTLDLLRFLGRRIGTSKVLIVATFRDDELMPDHPLKRLLGDLASAGTSYRLEVPRLSLAAVTELAAGSPLDPGDLYRRTEGNAFFVTEVLSAPSEKLPAAVGDAVLARLARLSPGAVHALEMTAVVGQAAEISLLNALLPDPETLDECLTAGLLSSRRGTLSFRHELAREAVLGSMPVTRIQRAHSQVLAALEREEELAAAAALDADPAVPGTRPARLTVLARHAAGAGDGPAVLRYAPQAGRLALSLRAFREAQVHFERALGYADDLPVAQRVALLERHALSLMLLNRTDEAVSSLRAAAELLEEPEQWQERGRVMVEMVWSLCSVFRDQDAHGVLAELEELLSEHPESSLAAAVYFLRAWTTYELGDSSVRLARLAEEIAERRGERRLAIEARAITAISLGAAGRVAAAVREAELAAESATAAAQDDLVVAPYVNLATGLLESYRLRQAGRALVRAAQLGHELGLFDRAMTPGQSYQALLLFRQGDWAAADDLARKVLYAKGPSSQLAMRVLVLLGLLRVRTGDGDPHQYLQLVAERTGPETRLATVVMLRSALAEAAWAAGDAETARAEAEMAFERVLRAGSRWHVGELAYWLWKSGAGSRLPDEERGPFAMQIRGRPAAAAARWRRLGCPYEEAVALSEVGTVAALRRALEIFTSLGAAPAVNRVGAELRRLGERGVPRGPIASTLKNPAGLTSREQQVLLLIAKGLRNAEIASHNRVSSRTIDHQVSAILGKLGVKTRAEAVASAKLLGLVGE